MTPDQEERVVSAFEKLVLSFESIADSFKGVHDEAQRAGRRFWPKRGAAVEAVVTRVPNELDKILDEQGANDRRSVHAWTTDIGDEPEPEETIGAREREFLEREKARSKGPKSKASGAAGGAETPQS